MANSGYGFQYIWPDFPWFASKARPVFAVASGALSMLFLVSFVGSSRRVKKIVVWVNVIMWIYIAIILSFNNKGYQTKWWMYIQYLIPVITLLYVLLVLFFLIRKSWQGNRFAQFYLAGALILITTTIMQASIQLGNFKEWQYFFSNFGLATGYVAESIILTAGLVYRFNQYRKEKEKLLVEMNQRQQEHIRILVKVQEAERSQVANQLHDVAGSLLSAAKLNLSALREKGNISEVAVLHAAKAEEAVGMVSDMVRNLSHALSPVMLEKVGFRTSLEKVVAIVNASGRINIQVIILGFDKYETALNNYYTSLYSVVYELLNNIVKHAGAKHVLVQVTEHADCFSLIVEDDGSGIDPGQLDEKDSMGMTAIQAKIDYFRGYVAFNKNQPTGLIVTIEIPIIRDV
ncbi:MAG: 7TM diverse intracellular signaling domain-containing protein [Bacteroidota bacterium]|nr:7TM diverse intracellular signaling domain-containing protein [Bacteroidota bacterium]